jgi:putative membrane protein
MPLKLKDIDPFTIGGEMHLDGYDIAWISGAGSQHHAVDHHVAGSHSPWPWISLLLVLAVVYAIGYLQQPAGKTWPVGRTWAWYGGLLVAGAALVGPLADGSHMDFSVHMLGHVLLGMLAPILLVLGAPITLVLRALPVTRARQGVRVLSSRPLRMLTHPAVAAGLNVGGLTVVYRTGLYQLMHEQAGVHVLVHVHILAVGYLFTAGIIGIDPLAHRPSYLSRGVVLVLALGAHAVLAKSLYVTPPAGVPVDQAQIGSQLMYYGGDIVHLLLIVVFFGQWYHATRPRPRAATAVVDPAVAER